VTKDDPKILSFRVLHEKTDELLVDAEDILEAGRSPNCHSNENPREERAVIASGDAEANLFTTECSSHFLPRTM
jgi:hypothetical protein